MLRISMQLIKFIFYKCEWNFTRRITINDIGRWPRYFISTVRYWKYLRFIICTYVIKWLRSICHCRDNIGLLAWLIMMIFWGKNSRYTFDSQSGYNEVHYHFWLCESYLFNVNLAYQLISIRVKSLNAFIVVAFIVVLLNAVFFVTAIQAILYFFFFSFPTLLFRVFSYYTLVTIDLA